jgi:UDP-N-acetylmuramoyl-L-alanyl-D-glutamate--2,6-diaminopimelate ligase
LKLENVIEGLKVIQLAGEVERKDIGSLEYDSRNVKRGSLFVAIKGIKTDGHKYLMEAVSKGAAAILIEDDASIPNDYLIHQNVTKILVKDSRKALAQVSSKFYKDPSRKLKIFGVTGTNGKTTVTYILKSILEQAGNKVGLIGTIKNYIGENVITTVTTDKTTPESLEINQMLYQMVEAGCTHCVMEVSSHSLALDRVFGIDFSGAIFTNLTQEHLDFHHKMENYFKSKKKLFDNLSKDAIAVSNFDNSYGERILTDTRAKNISYGAKSLYDYSFAKESFDFSSTSFDLMFGKRILKVKSNLIGKFNIYNITACAALCKEFGISEESILAGISKVAVIPGRFQVVGVDYPIKVIVDYSHTSDALENCLSSIREVLQNQKKSSRVITVFGAGGNRDRTKRPLMAKAVERYSDQLIITSDNPRNEDPEKIIEDILAGISNRTNARTIPDREEAIKEAIENADENDVLLIAGKGHEDYQIVGDKKIRFNDEEVVKKYLREKFGR